jgi:hypothetical protein
MEIASKSFPKGLPTLEEVKALNAGLDVPPETAWFWGKDDEASFSLKAVHSILLTVTNLSPQRLDALTSSHQPGSST